MNISFGQSNHKRSTIREKAVITGTTIAGLSYGTIRGFKAVSMQEIDQLNKLKPSAIDLVQTLIKCFDIKKFKEVYSNGEVGKEALSSINSFIKSARKRLKWEKILNKVANTPLEKRTISYEKALKKANNAAFDMNKQWVMAFTHIEEFAQKGLFNKNLYDDLMKAGKKRVKTTYKILGPKIVAGAVMGTIAGIFIGKGINSLFKTENI